MIFVSFCFVHDFYIWIDSESMKWKEQEWRPILWKKKKLEEQKRRISAIFFILVAGFVLNDSGFRYTLSNETDIFRTHTDEMHWEVIKMKTAKH